MSFGWLGGLMSLFPEVLHGRQQAINDNWNDEKNFGSVQAQQDANAYNEATFAPRVGNEFLGYNKNYYDMLDKGMQTAQGMAAHPGRMTYNWTMSQYAPQLSLNKVMTQGLEPYIAMQIPFIQSGQEAPASIMELYNRIWGPQGYAPAAAAPSALGRR